MKRLRLALLSLLLLATAVFAADMTVRHPNDNGVILRFKDMGDGTWSQVNTTGGTGYPSAATAVQSSSGNVANASAVSTLAGAAAKTTYITGFEVTGAGATAAAVVSVTVTGLLGGTATYTYTAVAGATSANAPLVVTFSPPLPASTTNTAIVVTVPALGAGDTNSTVTAHGYQV